MARASELAPLIVAALALSCRAAPAPVVSPSPVATVADASTWRFEAAPLELPRAYVELHGRDVPGIATPWAEEAARVLGVDMARIVDAVHAEPSLVGKTPIVLVSPTARTGDFTFVISTSVQIYEVVPVQLAESTWVAALGTNVPPDEQALDDGDAQWTIALIDPTSPRVATVSLRTAIPTGPAALWESTSTAMTVSDGALHIEIGFAHTGGGDPCDQVFTFEVHAGAGPALRLGRTRADVSPCR